MLFFGLAVDQYVIKVDHPKFTNERLHNMGHDDAFSTGIWICLLGFLVGAYK